MLAFDDCFHLKLGWPSSDFTGRQMQKKFSSPACTLETGDRPSEGKVWAAEPCKNRIAKNRNIYIYIILITIIIMIIVAKSIQIHIIHRILQQYIQIQYNIWQTLVNYNYVVSCEVTFIKNVWTVFKEPNFDEFWWENPQFVRMRKDGLDTWTPRLIRTCWLCLSSSCAQCQGPSGSAGGRCQGGQLVFYLAVEGSTEGFGDSCHVNQHHSSLWLVFVVSFNHGAGATLCLPSCWVCTHQPQPLARWLFWQLPATPLRRGIRCSDTNGSRKI